MTATDAAGRRDELLLDAPVPWALPLPRDLVGDERAAWPARAADDAAASAAHWPAEAVELLPAILEHALDSRGDEGLVLFLLSPTAPACATLRIAVLPSPGRAAVARDLRAAPRTALVTRIEGAGLGDGAEWVHGAPMPGGSGEQLAGLQWCFAGDDELVLATLDPVPPPMLAHVVDLARELVSGLRRVRDDGDWLAPALPEGVGFRTGEAWPDPAARAASVVDAAAPGGAGR